MRRQDSPWWRNGFTKEWWKELDAVARFNFLELLSEAELEDFYRDWRVWARDDQLFPDGVWTSMLLCCGRGWGKTRSIVEFANDEVRSGRSNRFAIVGQGETDIREVLIEGDSGFLNTAPSDFRPKFLPSVGAGRLEWPNGATGYLYSAEDPEALRGPQFDMGIFDEPMAVPAEKRAKTVSNLKFGLRLGRRPRLIYATTPKPHRWIREEMAKAQKYAHLPMAERKYVVVRGSTFDNADNLPESFFEGIIEDYDGTNLGRQEIYAEILGEEEGAIWTSELLDRQRILENVPSDPVELFAWQQQFARESERVIVAVDPNTKSNSTTAHAAGIVVLAKRGAKRFVIVDRTTKGGPDKWAKAAMDAYDDFEADEIVAEVNQGGDMVKMVVQAEASDRNQTVKVHMVRATRGKQRRAEPVGAAYERGMVHHLGAVGTNRAPGPFFKLESQMVSLHEALDPTGEDFDRCDAVVWGLTRLGLKKQSRSAARGSSGILTFGDFGQHAQT